MVGDVIKNSTGISVLAMVIISRLEETCHTNA